MSNFKTTPALILLLVLTIFTQSSFAKFATSEELTEKYPSISESSTRPQNKKILCPFWRLIERSGALDAIKVARKTDVIVSLSNIVDKAFELGCEKFGCGAVATLVSGGQLTKFATRIGHVNLSKLHKATGVAHDCGFTFEKGASEISEKQIATTLSRMKQIADSNPIQGTLYKSDLMKVKLQICKEQGVKITKPGDVEVGLIFSFLGGKDNNHIQYEDVVRLFNAEMPKTKAVNAI